MNTRLQQFLAAENLSQSQFADKIGVARASITHIISGRNKPGFDFISNMALSFPDLNLDWLITGKGNMYKTDSDKSSGISSDKLLKPEIKPDSDRESKLSDSFDLFSIEPASETPPSTQTDDRKPVARPSPFRKAAHYSETKNTSESDGPKKIGGGPLFSSGSNQIPSQKSVSKVIVFFTDGTFQELKNS